MQFLGRLGKVLAAIAGVLTITFLARAVLGVNATTSAFAYLLFVLIVASAWGFLEASITSVAATILLNYNFFPPVGTLTIADPQNWVALFSFLASSLIASRLSALAKRQTLDAIARQRDIERLYTLSRSILLIGGDDPFPKQLVQRLADVFVLDAVVLYDRRAEHSYHAGPQDFAGMEEQLKESARNGTSYQDPARHRVVTAIRLGSEPIASLALQGQVMPDAVLQGISNLVAIGLERARAHELTQQVEAAEQTERLRTALIDAMAHEFKTPLTSIKAATTSLLADRGQPESTQIELLKIADEEADHLKDLINYALELAKLEESHIDVRPTVSNLDQAVQEVLTSMRATIDGRTIQVSSDPHLPAIPFDARLTKLAIKQVLDNALKYSPPELPIEVQTAAEKDVLSLEITDHGRGISPAEQGRVFQRFYRSPSVEKRIPGSGLGLSIAHRILQAHRGDLTVASEPGRTTFRLTLPLSSRSDKESH